MTSEADREKTTTNSVNWDALMRANIEQVFNERDGVRRRAAVERLYSEDATLYDSDAVAKGWDGISRAVGSLLDSLPTDIVFTPAGPAVGHNGVGRIFWRSGPPGGAVAVTGTDVVHLDGDRIKHLHVFLDPTPR